MKEDRSVVELFPATQHPINCNYSARIKEIRNCKNRYLCFVEEASCRLRNKNPFFL